jgi:hypothetical protein
MASGVCRRRLDGEGLNRLVQLVVGQFAAVAPCAEHNDMAHLTRRGFGPAQLRPAGMRDGSRASLHAVDDGGQVVNKATNETPWPGCLAASALHCRNA